MPPPSTATSARRVMPTRPEAAAIAVVLLTAASGLAWPSSLALPA